MPVAATSPEVCLVKELSKSIPRRLHESNFCRRYFVGHGLDVGGKPDPLCLYSEFFPLLRSIRTWDREDGDAQFLASVPDNHLDFVHSSHCLEHLDEPRQGLVNWLRVVKPNGHVIVTVPDEDLYEQGIFPSTFNRDHKWTFTLWKQKSWSRRSINVLELLGSLGPYCEPVKVEVLNATFRFTLPRYDQTMSPVGECAIEFILRKRTSAEVEVGGLHTRSTNEPQRELRLHLNQYRDDIQQMKTANTSHAPFTNDKPI